jgi:hypothetical protein
MELHSNGKLPLRQTLRITLHHNHFNLGHETCGQTRGRRRLSHYALVLCALRGTSADKYANSKRTHSVETVNQQSGAIQNQRPLALELAIACTSSLYAPPGYV